MVSPLYRLPKKIKLSSELKPVPDNITSLNAYPFSVERDALTEVETGRKQIAEMENQFNAMKQQYEEDKIKKKRVAARKIAPGFLDTDTRILRPEPTYSTELNITSEESEEEDKPEIDSPRILQPSVSNQHTSKSIPIEIEPERHFDYLKFEQGLAPADPWDTPENDLAALSSILGSPKTNYNINRLPSPSYSSHTYHQPRPHANEGVYWKFPSPNNTNNTSNNNYSQPPIMNRPHPPPVNNTPALPPKYFNTSPLPSSSLSSPVISPPQLPPPGNYHKSLNTPTPPPLPPLPNQNLSPYEDLVTELVNMGFTRAQSIDALEKNDHDLIKTTNFLLDQDA
ncbi:hypothetical protein BDB01DRAFT_532929 [Pilobolus umbonatus]|nr:hypothetical protein BDB01DRAFT_532929 [Pilobolus umbonatus]